MEKIDAAILRYIQPAIVMLKQNTDNLIAKSCEVADVHDEELLTGVFIEEVDSSIHHGLRHYLAQNPQVDLTDIAFQAKSLYSIQKGAGITSRIDQNSSAKESYTRGNLGITAHHLTLRDRIQ